jgi:lambda repressor-like predicted transcriptional regulator
VGLRGRELEAYLYDDHRTLAELARRRGLDPERLADALVTPWASTVDAAALAVLRARTLRVLTQGHLAQHMFFHIYHGLEGASQVFGLSAEAYVAARLRGATPAQLARRHGVSTETVRRSMSGLFRADREQGVRSQQAWPAESDRILERRTGLLGCWLRKPLARFDPGNPYGKQMRQHGAHPRAWPATVRERRVDQARVERSRRALSASCWRPPPAWRPGAAAGPPL